MGVEGTISKLREYFNLWHKESSDVHIDLIYPVGSIYMSTNENVNPNNIFKNTEWEPIEGYFLLGRSDEYPLKKRGNKPNTGGEAVHALTQNELATHTHNQAAHGHTQRAHNHYPFSSSDAHGCSNQTGWWFIAGKNTDPATDGYQPNIVNTRNARSLGSLNDGNTGHVMYATTATNFCEYSTTNSVAPEIVAESTPIAETGESTPHNNMPPYMVVNIWERIA